jgi:hypothetical protein
MAVPPIIKFVGVADGVTHGNAGVYLKLSPSSG